MAGVVERDRLAPRVIVGGVLGLNLVQQALASRRSPTLPCMRREPRFEGGAVALELGQPGPVAGQEILGDEPLLIEEGAHRGGVVDERELPA